MDAGVLVVRVSYRYRSVPTLVKPPVSASFVPITPRSLDPGLNRQGLSFSLLYFFVGALMKTGRKSEVTEEETKAVVRVIFGALIESARLAGNENRGAFARRMRVKAEVLRNLEHGIVNPSREELVRSINLSKLSRKEKNRAYFLLNIFSPVKNKRWKRVKHDSKHVRAQIRRRVSNLRRRCHR